MEDPIYRWTHFFANCLSVKALVGAFMNDKVDSFSECELSWNILGALSGINK